MCKYDSIMNHNFQFIVISPFYGRAGCFISSEAESRLSRLELVDYP